MVLGSLLSGLGKGIVSSSIAKILSLYGYNAMPLKFDGYLNYDCGTMNPFRHGEVFVLEDGGEVDMDFGTYERFMDRNMKSSFSLTGGKVMNDVISMERKGEFLGQDVQIIPQVTDYLIKRIESLSQKEHLDVLIIEVGGTVGDIENGYFVEAMRQLGTLRKTVFIDVTMVPELEAVGEQKTKPTQIGLRSLRQDGIQPDFMICRTTRALEDRARGKIALFANLPPEAVIDDHDVPSIYDMPELLMRQKLDKMLIGRLGLERRTINRKALNEWKRCLHPGGSKNKPVVSVAIVGKYIKLHDAYASVKESLSHAAMKNNVELKINWVESEYFEGKDAERHIGTLADSDCVLVPGGFGKRGIEGMIRAIQYARTSKKPYLGLCLGMQLMVVEYARNVCKLDDANSTEFGKTPHNVIDLLEGQRGLSEKGATMRLGAAQIKVMGGTLAHSIYGSGVISERHRHRYELNNKFRGVLERGGLVISATTTDGQLAEMVEWRGQFGIGIQAHPEFKSRPEHPAPLFEAFIRDAAAGGA